MPPELLEIVLSSLGPLALYLARISGLFLASPFFKHQSIPGPVKAALLMMLTFIMFGAAGPGNWAYAPPEKIAAAMIMEIMVGAFLGLTVRMLFAIIEIAGEFLSFQMGFAAASMYDPSIGGSAAPPTRLLYMVSFALFLAIDGHHQVILALRGSYKVVPVGEASLAAVDFDGFFELIYGLFMSASRIAFPFLFVMLSINFVLGIVARFVPQVNVFMIGFIFTMGFGMMAMAELMPSLGEAFVGILDGIPEFVRLSR